MASSAETGIEHDLTVICGWALTVREQRGALAAIRSAMDVGPDIPYEVATALRGLDRFGVRHQAALLEQLEQCFLELESRPACTVYVERRLVPEPRARSVLARQLAVTQERVRQLEQQGERMIVRMRDEVTGPLRTVTDHLQRALGSAARFADLALALEGLGIDVDPKAESQSARQGLLLDVAGYECTVSGWVCERGLREL